MEHLPTILTANYKTRRKQGLIWEDESIWSHNTYPKCFHKGFLYGWHNISSVKSLQPFCIHHTLFSVHFCPTSRSKINRWRENLSPTKNYEPALATHNKHEHTHMNAWILSYFTSLNSDTRVGAEKRVSSYRHFYSSIQTQTLGCIHVIAAFFAYAYDQIGFPRNSSEVLAQSSVCLNNAFFE